jgi:hypothetical protein
LQGPSKFRSYQLKSLITYANVMIFFSTYNAQRVANQELCFDETFVDTIFRNVDVLEDQVYSDYYVEDIYTQDDNDDACSSLSGSSTAESSTMTSDDKSKTSSPYSSDSVFGMSAVFNDHEAPLERTSSSMDKLAECMARSAMSCSLVEQFCQVALKEHSRPQPPCKRLNTSPQAVPPIARRTDVKKKPKQHRRQTRIGCKIRSISSESAIGSFLRQSKSTNNPMLFRSKSKDFRASGVRL